MNIAFTDRLADLALMGGRDVPGHDVEMENARDYDSRIISSVMR